MGFGKHDSDRGTEWNGLTENEPISLQERRLEQESCRRAASRRTRIETRDLVEKNRPGAHADVLHPGEQGSKPGSEGGFFLDIRGRRAASRRTRIETLSSQPNASFGQADVLHPGEQGSKPGLLGMVPLFKADVLHPGEQGSKQLHLRVQASRLNDADVLHPGEQGSKQWQAAALSCRRVAPTCCIQENKDRNILPAAPTQTTRRWPSYCSRRAASRRTRIETQRNNLPAFPPSSC